MEKKVKVWIVLDADYKTRKDSGFGNNDDLRFGRFGAEVRRAEKIMETKRSFLVSQKLPVIREAWLTFKI